MFTDVLVEDANGQKQLIRVESGEREISDIIARRLAYEYVYDAACANNDLVARYAEVVTLSDRTPECAIGLDAKRK